MALVNENYLQTPRYYYLNEVLKILNAYNLLYPNAKVINLCAGGPHLSPPNEVSKALHQSIEDIGNGKVILGLDPTRGFDFLIKEIIKEYRSCGVKMEKQSVFINSGIKYEIVNIGHVLGGDNIIAITDPVFPTYENTAVISGRAGDLGNDGRWRNILYLKCPEEHGFIPQLPDQRVDVIYLCNPCNPTGVAMNRDTLKKWVDYAIENHTLLIYDGAYYPYITDPSVPQSIYEIKGSRKVAMELRSYSTLTDFTGLRCGYSIIPHELMLYCRKGKKLSLQEIWINRNKNYNSNTSYIAQWGAKAVYSKKGKEEVKSIVEFYLGNISLIKDTLKKIGFKVFGGENAPYLWFKIPNKSTSVEYYQYLLHNFNIVTGPGILFGTQGDGYMRISAFNSRENVIEGMERLKSLSLR